MSKSALRALGALIFLTFGAMVTPPCAMADESNRFSGVVLDSDGVPIEGAEVAISFEHGLDVQWDPTTKSDRDGRFEFVELEKEPQQLRIRCEGYATYSDSFAESDEEHFLSRDDRLQIVLVGRIENFDEARPSAGVQRDDSESAGVEVDDLGWFRSAGLRVDVSRWTKVHQMLLHFPGFAPIPVKVPATYPRESDDGGLREVDLGLVRLARAEPIEVRVVDLDGNPISGVAIQAPRFDAAVMTDAAGIVRVELPEGSVDVRAEHPECDTFSETLEPGQSAYTLTLTRHAKITFEIVDKLGRSLAGYVDVTSFDPEDFEDIELADSEFEDLEFGAFEFEEIELPLWLDPEWDYVLQFYAFDHGLRSVAVKALESGETRDLGRITLEPLPRVRITGRVVSESLRPVAGVKVVADRYPDSDLPVHEGPLDSARTDQSGAFTLSVVRSSLELDIGFEGERIEAVSRSLVPSEDLDLGDVVVVSHQTRLVEGRVVDSDGAPISGAEIMSTVESYVVLTDAAGGYAFDVSRSVRSDGSILVGVRRDGYLKQTTTLEVDAAGVARDLILERAADLSILLHVPDGRVLESYEADLMLFRDRKSLYTGGARFRGNRLSLSGLPSGECEYRIATPDRGFLGTVYLEAGVETKVVLDFDQPTNKTVYIVDDRQQPVAGLRVRLKGRAQWSRASWVGRTDMMGRVEVPYVTHLSTLLLEPTEEQRYPGREITRFESQFDSEEPMTIVLARTMPVAVRFRDTEGVVDGEIRRAGQPSTSTEDGRALVYAVPGSVTTIEFRPERIPLSREAREKETPLTDLTGWLQFSVGPDLDAEFEFVLPALRVVAVEVRSFGKPLVKSQQVIPRLANQNAIFLDEFGRGRMITRSAVEIPVWLTLGFGRKPNLGPAAIPPSASEDDPAIIEVRVAPMQATFMDSSGEPLAGCMVEDDDTMIRADAVGRIDDGWRTAGPRELRILGLPPGELQVHAEYEFGEHGAGEIRTAATMLTPFAVLDQQGELLAPGAVTVEYSAGSGWLRAQIDADQQAWKLPQVEGLWLRISNHGSREGRRTAIAFVLHTALEEMGDQAVVQLLAAGGLELDGAPFRGQILKSPTELPFGPGVDVPVGEYRVRPAGAGEESALLIIVQSRR